MAHFSLLVKWLVRAASSAATTVSSIKNRVEKFAMLSDGTFLIRENSKDPARQKAKLSGVCWIAFPIKLGP